MRAMKGDPTADLSSPELRLDAAVREADESVEPPTSASRPG
jgi:hypothetical protein